MTNNTLGLALATVLVRCVWPEERGPKDDCRGGTGIVWAGNGDVQAYPAHLWPKLAGHPDVWELVAANDAAPAPKAPAADDDAQALADKKAEAAGKDTDLVIADVNVTLTAEDLAAMSDADVRALAVKRDYGLHPRLNPENLRSKFLEAQAAVAEPAATA